MIYIEFALNEPDKIKKIVSMNINQTTIHKLADFQQSFKKHG